MPNGSTAIVLNTDIVSEFFTGMKKSLESAFIELTDNVSN